AAREIEGQAEAEADAGLDLAHALEHLLRGHEVDPAELVVVPEIAPGRAVRALCPPARRHAGQHCMYRPVGLTFAARGHDARTHSGGSPSDGRQGLRRI